MGNHSTKLEEKEPLMGNLMQLIEAHRPAFQQERPYQRAVWFLLSELFSFGRHTVTQGLMALGETEGDWSAWYRLFSHKRFDYSKLTGITMGETLKGVSDKDPYVVAIDGMIVPRSSQKMPGTSWWKALGSAPFKPGLARGQRFVHLSWLPKMGNGYSRAIPLQMMAAFPEKAVAGAEPKRKDWEAGLEGLRWVRSQLDAAQREKQRVLALVVDRFTQASGVGRKRCGPAILRPLRQFL